MSVSRVKKRRLFRWGLGTGTVLLGGLLCADVEDATSGATLTHDASTGTTVLNWDASPEHYYFVEQSTDLMSYDQVKLSRDLDENGSLSMGLMTNAEALFFRLYRTDDKGDAALRADDDGDGIINLLEADAGMNAFEAEDPTDSEPDGLPDSWEQFYFESLEHDGSYIAVTGGLTLAEAFAAGTDPRMLDSDDDGWTDVQEIAWGWDPNYDQSRDDGGYTATGDRDGDGIPNSVEAANSSSPVSPNGTRPVLRILNAVDTLHLDEGESYTLRFQSYDPDGSEIQGVSITRDGTTLGNATLTHNDFYEFDWVNVSASTEAIIIEAKTISSDLSEASINPIKVDIAEGTKWISISQAGRIDGWRFERQLNGSIQSVQYGDYYRGPELFDLSYPDGELITQIDLSPFSDVDELVIAHTPFPGTYTPAVFSNAALDFPLNSTVIVNRYGATIHGKVEYGTSEESFTVADGEHVVVSPVRGYPQSDDSWDEKITMFTYSDIRGSDVAIFGNTLITANNRKRVLQILPPNREGSFRAGALMDLMPISPRIVATAHHPGTLEIPGSPRHFLNNDETGSLLFIVNEDMDDGESPDNQDTLIGANDDDLVKIDIKVDMNGFTEWDHFELIPSSDKIRLYTVNNGNATLAPLSDGKFTSTLKDHNLIATALKSDDGLGILIEGMDTSNEESLEILVAESDEVDAARIRENVKIGPLLKVDVVPDYDRDGVIRKDSFTDSNGKVHPSDYQRAVGDDPFYFWINNDGDHEGKDIPNGFADDALRVGVGGVADLVDFFPVFIDFHGLLDNMDVTKVQIELLGPEVAWLDFPEDYIGLNENSAKFYLENVTKAEEWGDATTTQAGDGVYFTQKMVERIRDGRGIVLLEGHEVSDEPLQLRFSYDGTELFAYNMELKLSNVEDMYRHVNLLSSIGQSGGTGTNTGEPSGLPDSENNGKHFVFVHGYNVNPEQARGWNAETFKRLYWTGSRAKFTGATWYGYRSQIAGLNKAPNYYENIINAHRSGSYMASAISGYGGDITLAGHSMGNVVLSSGIVDHGLSYNRYFLLNAAVATEAYDSGTITPSTIADMTNDAFANYDSRLYASNWHNLFTDNRNALTWKDRYGSISNAYNFYSSGEDVLENANGSSPPVWDGIWRGTRAWNAQEWNKGSDTIGLITDNQAGGWGFNYFPPDPTVGTPGSGYFEPLGAGIPGYRKYTPTEAAALTDDELRNNPFFYPFQSTDSDYGSYNGDNLYGLDGDAVASNQAGLYLTRAKLLAEAIPALSYATGSNPVSDFGTGFNIDINDGIYRAGWPSSRGQDTDWRHSDMKNIPYTYIYKFYEEIVERGGLDAQ